MKIIHKLALPSCFLAVAGYVLLASIYFPHHNWDMIMYIAAAKSYEERELKSLHHFTYSSLQQSVTKAEYGNMTGGGYRRAVYTDPSAFQEQLPFYQIRPLYTAAVYLLYKAGLDIGFATHIISGLAVAAALLVLYFMSLSLLGPQLSYSVPFLALVFGVTDLARYSTPDGMAFLGVVLAAFLYLKQRIALLLLLLPLVLWVRTDLVLFTFPLLFFIFAAAKPFRKQVIFSMLISIALYASVNIYFDNPGWATTFYFTFIELLPHPLSMPPSLSMEHYFLVLGREIMALPINSTFVLYALLSVYALYAGTRGIQEKLPAHVLKHPQLILSIVCVVFIAAHFVLFPALWGRFFSGPYLVGTLLALAVLSEYMSSPT